MNQPSEETVRLAEELHRVYRKWAGNMGCGDHLPETWWAVAEAARAALAKSEEPR